jgi:hypothetical protein
LATQGFGANKVWAIELRMPRRILENAGEVCVMKFSTGLVVPNGCNALLLIPHGNKRNEGGCDKQWPELM